MHRLLITTDLHQHRAKWDRLVGAAADERPAFILIAGDILPKDGGFTRQRRFFPRLRGFLTAIRDQTGARVLLYLCNDDGHFLEPLVDELAADGLCVNLNQRVHREGGLVFCGMNKVRDYPFGYKHYCVPDGSWVADPLQFCGQGLTFDDKGNEVEIPDLRQYLLGKRSLLEHLQDLKAQLEPGELERSVWMVHQPPASLGMDICANGKRVGSPTLLQFIGENQPLLGCSGHIHESPHQPGDRWNGIQERHPVADEVAAEFGLRVVGVYGTHDAEDNMEPLPEAFSSAIILIYTLYGGETPSGIYGAKMASPGLDHGGWEFSRGERITPAITQKQILKVWRARVGPTDYSNNHETEYPRLYGSRSAYGPHHAPAVTQKPAIPPPPLPEPVDRPELWKPAGWGNPSSAALPDPVNRLELWTASERKPLDVTSLDRDQGIVANSIRQQTTLTFTYFGGSRPGDRRTVLPKQLFRVEGYPCIYLLADDVDLQEERVFRLDRMEW